MVDSLPVACQADRERIRRALITLGDENKKVGFSARAKLQCERIPGAQVVSQVKAVVAAVEDAHGSHHNQVDPVLLSLLARANQVGLCSRRISPVGPKVTNIQ